MWVAISKLLSIAQISAVNTANLTTHAVSDAKEIFSKPTLFIEPGDEFIIEVKSMSNPVEKASIALGYRLSIIKQGFRSTGIWCHPYSRISIYNLFN